MSRLTEIGMSLLESDNSMSIMITLPSDIEWRDYQSELLAAAAGDILNFKVPAFPQHVGVGDKCYIVHRGYIRGWHTICGFSEKEFTCTTTGKPFKGKFIERTGPFNYLPEPLPYKGFQGFRYFNMSNYIKELQDKPVTEDYEAESAEDTTVYAGLENITTHDDIDYVFLYPKASDADKVYFRNNLDRIYDFLDEGYKYAKVDGGFQGFSSHKDMKRKTSLCILAFKDSVMIAVSIHNDYIEGDKCVGMTVTTNPIYRSAGVGALVKMISYMTKNWDKWLWIEASDKIEIMFENAQEELKNSDSVIDSTKLPVEISLRIMNWDGNNKSIAAVDEYHYRRPMQIRLDGEANPTTINVRKVIYGFPSQEYYDMYIKIIKTTSPSDKPISESWWSYSKNQVKMAYNQLLTLMDFANLGDFEYIPPEMKNSYERAIKILQRSRDQLGRQKEYVDEIVTQCEYILSQIRPPQPKSLVESLKKCGLI